MLRYHRFDLRSFVILTAVTCLGSSIGGCEYSIGDDRRGAREATLGAEAPPCDRMPSGGAANAPRSCDVTIDRWKELLVIHRSVLMDRRSRNDVAGAPWSFRSRLEELAGDPTLAPRLTRAWLDTWKTVTTVGPDEAPVTPRPAVDTVLVNPWLAASAASDAYGSASSELDLAKTPFSLIAIVNRIDLRERRDGCAGSAGELRFVYTARSPESGQALAMTVIIEIPYPATRSPREWAERWHELAKLPFGAQYNSSLETLTRDVTEHAPPQTVRVRTNEIAFGHEPELPWELREHAVRADASIGANRLVLVPLITTPRMSLRMSSSLDAWTRDNQASVLAGTHVLPGSFQAGAAEVPTRAFRWESSGLDDELRGALSQATCNGCHGGERGHAGGDLFGFQHLAPWDGTDAYYPTSSDGETRVSRYLHDPSGSSSGSSSGSAPGAGSEGDALGRRAQWNAELLCGTCADEGATSPYSR